jgi:hypothetical protein
MASLLSASSGGDRRHVCSYESDDIPVAPPRDHGTIDEDEPTDGGPTPAPGHMKRKVIKVSSTL